MKFSDSKIKVLSQWRVYLFIVISATILLMTVLFLQWEAIKKENWLELTYINRLVSSSVEDRFNQQEAMLKMLGERLMEIGLNEDRVKAQRLLDTFLDNNPVFAAYGLALPNGNIILTSKNLNNKVLPNLKKAQSSANAFQETLNSQGIVIGHTYFFKPLNDWIIPLRYAIRDSNQKVIAVITTGILLDGKYNPWKFSNLSDNFYIDITKDSTNDLGFYVQYSNSLLYEKDYKKRYLQKIPQKYIEKIEAAIIKTNGVGIDGIRQKQGIVSYSYTDDNFNIFHETSSFNPKLRLFTTVGHYDEYLWRHFIPKLIAYTSVFILFNFILFLLFRYIVRLQDKTAKELHYKAMHDQLTGLPNRYYLSSEFENWCLKHSQFSLLYLDLNNFKLINDNYGHSVGDKMLLEVAKRLKASTYGETMIIRYGGDEFILLYPNDDVISIDKFISHCNYQLSEPMEIHSMSFSITGTFGIAIANTAQNSLELLLSHADLAMHKAKKEHNVSSLFNATLLEVSIKQAEIERYMHSALKNNEFYLVYQPQVNANTKAIVGIEALLRWENKELGSISPDSFIPIAERSGFINELGDFVIDTALSELASLKRDIPISLSINVSINQLLISSFTSNLNSKAHQYGIDRTNIVIEITESLFIEDVERIKVLLQNLQSEGYTISLDDFGTGYSSLSILSKMPIGELKIDKSFVRDILVDAQDRTLIQSILSIGKSLQISTLAEGVEEEEQASMLQEFGCDIFQGFYFARPMRKEQLEQFLKSSNE